MNKVILNGRITKDLELKVLQNNTVVEFSIACNRKIKDKKETTFIDVTAWGKQAEMISKYFSKGSSILVEGRLSQREWEKEGKKFYKTFVTLEDFHFTGSKK